MGNKKLFNGCLWKILRRHFSQIFTGGVVFNAAQVAEELGNPRVMNVVLLGAMAEVLQLDKLDWETALKVNVPERFIEINQEAFKRGRELARSEEEAYAP